MDIGGVACVAVTGLLIGMLVGAVVLRAAAAIANRLIGPAAERRETVDRLEDWDWDAEPGDPRPEAPAPKPAVPEPGYGKGMMVASAANAVTAFVGFVCGTLLDESDPGALEDATDAIPLLIVAVPFGFGALSLLLVAVLPTTFRRAALVAFFYYLIGFVLMGTVTVALLAAWEFGR
jgi:hypothetical protein